MSLEDSKHADMLFKMASVYAKKKEQLNLEHALYLSEKGLTLREKLGSEASQSMIDALELNSDIQYRLGKLNQAFFDLDKAYKMSRRIGSPNMKFLLRCASLKKKLDEFEVSAAIYESALAMKPPLSVQMQILVRLSKLYNKLRD